MLNSNDGCASLGSIANESTDDKGYCKMHTKWVSQAIKKLCTFKATSFLRIYKDRSPRYNGRNWVSNEKLATNFTINCCLPGCIVSNDVVSVVTDYVAPPREEIKAAAQAASDAF